MNAAKDVELAAPTFRIKERKNSGVIGCLPHETDTNVLDLISYSSVNYGKLKKSFLVMLSCIPCCIFQCKRGILNDYS